MKTSIKAIGFDLDGTLINSIHGILSTFRRAYQEVTGRNDISEVSDDEIAGLVGIKLEEMFRYLGLNESVVKSASQRYRELYLDIMKENTLIFPGVIEVISWLKQQGYKVALITAKGRHHALAAMEYTGISADAFDVIVTREDVTKMKPHPEAINLACRILACRPEEFAYVGDAITDMECALAAGARGFAVGYGPYPYRGEHCARRVKLTDLTRLPLLLQEREEVC